MDLNIVLVAPLIPQNTGATGRLCVCLDARLHLIRPLGFSLEESYIRRAGLDYWEYVDLHVHDDWSQFLAAERPGRMFFLSTKGERSVYECAFEPGDYLVFGNESDGLPEPLYQEFVEQLFLIPMPGKHMRSHNLSNAVAIAAYEAFRQLDSGHANSAG